MMINLLIMIKMTEKFKKLINQSLLIKNPKNYYRGHQNSLSGLIPDNILLFKRIRGRFGEKQTRNIHHRFMLVINLKGAGEIILDGKRFSINPGQCMVIFPHQHHHFIHRETDINWLFITFENLDTEKVMILRDMVCVIPEHCLEYLGRLLSDYLEDQPSSINRIALLTALIINDITLSAKEKLPVNNNEVNFSDVDKINQFICANIKQMLSVEEIAEYFNYSASHFRARYRKAMGISLGAYIKGTRLAKAQSYLGTTDMSVAEIAEACGYSSVYAFSYAFKKFTGSSPAKFRQKIRK
jgi:AraC-like DNA-binding protein/mannose-6-phosphate isomerase-like protein (cupin superfamily)